MCVCVYMCIYILIMQVRNNSRKVKNWTEEYIDEFYYIEWCCSLYEEMLHCAHCKVNFLSQLKFLGLMMKKTARKVKKIKADREPADMHAVNIMERKKVLQHLSPFHYQLVVTHHVDLYQPSFYENLIWFILVYPII